MITVFWQYFHPSANSFPALIKSGEFGTRLFIDDKNKKREDKKEKTFILKHLKN